MDSIRQTGVKNHDIDSHRNAALDIACWSSFAAGLIFEMKPPKLPLSREERSEIWKSFWLHAVAATGFIIITSIAATVVEKAGIGTSRPLLISLLQGISNFLVWGRFVKGIEKYKESTGIPYPSTYFALALGSFIIVVGPLVLFLSLLIRLSNVPCQIEKVIPPEQEGTPRKAASEDVGSHRILSNSAKETPKNEFSSPSPVCKPVILPDLSSDISSRTAQPTPSPPAVQTAGATSASPSQPKPPIQPSAMDDDCFYEEVAKEIESNALKPGIWTRAFAEANGSHDHARALYIRLRVNQLSDARNTELERQRLAAAEEARQKAEEMENQRRADEEEARQKAEQLEKARLAEEEEARKRAVLLTEKRLAAEELERISAEKRRQDAIKKKEIEDNLHVQEAMEQARKAREIDEQTQRKVFERKQKEAAERAVARKKLLDGLMAPFRRYLVEAGVISDVKIPLPEKLKRSATSWDVHFGGLITEESMTGFVKRGKLRIENGTIIIIGWKLFNKALRVAIGILLACALTWGVHRLDKNDKIDPSMGSASVQRLLNVSFYENAQQIIGPNLPFRAIWNVKDLLFILISICIAGYVSSYHLALPGSETFVPVTRPKLRGRILTMKIREPECRKERRVRLRFRSHLDARVFQSHFEIANNATATGQGS